MNPHRRTIQKLISVAFGLTLFGLFFVAFRPIPLQTRVEIQDGRRITTTFERRWNVLPVSEWSIGRSRLSGLTACGPNDTTSIHGWNCGFFSVENERSTQWDKL